MAHPEWCMPELRDNFANMWGPPGRRPTSLNFAIPEVRQLKLDVIREVFERWDYDGIELDWSRHNSHFIPGTEYANRHYLTEFTREVRKITEAGARRLGHAVHVLARVPESLHGCTLGGYDVAAWFRDELVDGLVLGDMVVNVPYLHQFRDLMTNGPVPLFPSVYGYGMGYQLWDDATIRGVAASLWASGADGLATYNLYPKGEFRRKVLQQIGESRTMDGQSKRYLSPQSMKLGYTRFSRHNCPASALPALINLERINQQGAILPHTVWADLEVADDIPALVAEGKVDTVEVTVGIERVQPEDRIYITLNGHSLTEQWRDVIGPHIGTLTWDLNADDVEGSQPGGGDGEITHQEFEGLRFNPPPEWLRRGTNTVQVLILPSAVRPLGEDNGLPPIFVTRVELFTSFK